MQTGLHHVAYACKDIEATHKFYSEALDLKLIHTELTRFAGGWFRHIFYDLGNGNALAFFDLHGCGEKQPVKTAVSTDLGLPLWTNHVALRVDSTEQERLKKKCKDAGYVIAADHDHGWCRSVYIIDPNGILVELCTDTPQIPVNPELALKLMRSIPDGFTA